MIEPSASAPAAQASANVGSWWSKLAGSRRAALLICMLALLGFLRFGAANLVTAHPGEGDFYATLPGLYVESVNPVLWDSPDLSASWVVHGHYYYYGPVMYLTLYPIAYLDSYRQISLVLRPVYALILLCTAWLLWRLCRALERTGQTTLPRLGGFALVFGCVFLFSPILTAFVQREFEVVQTLMFVAGALCVVTGWSGVAGGLVGYIVLFKYWPAGMLGYFLLRRDWKGAAAFVGSIALVLVVTNAVFGLECWQNQSGFVKTETVFLLSPGSFCAGDAISATFANLHTGVCAMLIGHDGAAWAVYLGILLAMASAFVSAFIMHERRRTALDAVDARWRKILEFSLFTVAGCAVVHAHYYYLGLLVLPLTVLLYRYAGGAGGLNRLRLSLAALAYLILAVSVALPSVFTRLLGHATQGASLGYGIYVYGGVLLVGLLLWEYAELAMAPPSTQAVGLAAS